MTKLPNEKNERVKRRFLEYRKYASQLSEKTLDRENAALERFDVWNGRKDFARFHIEDAMRFRDHLEICRTANDKPLAKSTLRAILATLRAFALWLSQQEGYKKRIRPSDADYFKLSRRDEAIARNSPARPAPSVTQAKHVLSLMEASTPRGLRDKAIVSLLCLTGIRVTALTTLCLKHVNMKEKAVFQNPREVDTKFAKVINTFFQQGFEDAEDTLMAWLKHLDEVELYGPDDPLFPVTMVSAQSNTGFVASGFERRHWKSTEPVRKIVNGAFKAAGLPSYGPHAFRHMLARHAVKTSSTIREFVATAQNLGHADVLTTVRNYGQLTREQQRELITGLGPDEVG